MTKNILTGLLLAAISFTALFSCKKSSSDIADPTRHYFPLQFGRYVTYNVDSIYYFDSSCSQYEIKCQMKYAVTDTYTVHATKQLWYIMDIYTRPYDGGIWVPTSVVLLSPTYNALLYTQDQTEYVKMEFPITNGLTWQGNMFANVNAAPFAYLKGWNYTYQNLHKSYDNGIINFGNTVTCLEDDESVDYPNVNGNVSAYRTYAKEVYAYNVGMIYKEWTHWTFKPDSAQCVNGYRVIMQAVEYN